MMTAPTEKSAILGIPQPVLTQRPQADGLQHLVEGAVLRQHGAEGDAADRDRDDVGREEDETVDGRRLALLVEEEGQDQRNDDHDRHTGHQHQVVADAGAEERVVQDDAVVVEADVEGEGAQALVEAHADEAIDRVDEGEPHQQQAGQQEEQCLPAGPSCPPGGTSGSLGSIRCAGHGQRRPRRPRERQRRSLLVRHHALLPPPAVRALGRRPRVNAARQRTALDRGLSYTAGIAGHGRSSYPRGAV